MGRKAVTGWKGIVLAGGAGSRLHPITLVSSKQTLPVYDKPMIYYPISTLMLGGIRDILVISTPRDLPQFRQLLGDGTRLGVNFSFAEQPEPRGIAEAFIIGADFIGDSRVCLILGDNLFYGNIRFMTNALGRKEGATVFGYPVHDPERYGVVAFAKDGKALSIEEKPEHPKSKYAVPGLYCYDNGVVEMARNLKPSDRNELEITDINTTYLDAGKLHVERLGRGMAWLDTGTPQSLLEAGNFVASIENRQGLKIGSLEEVAYRMDYINAKQLARIAGEFGKGNAYGEYLAALVED
ncbi:MAG: glucose-1-phosphate thymidylyltransferase RfbA [Kiritimatiellae bacterium]|nr:glucose-1-phosphate thymidylyltransferase RfbA [Kiritimatiellia bacterium]